MFKKMIPLLVLAVSVGCATNPETGRKSLQLMPESTMNTMGAQAFNEVVQKSRISSDPRLTQIVNRVADRITRVTGANYDWEVKLVDSSEANAFVLPGGKIVIYTGILPICETEAGLAFVMGHEVGHAIAGHGNERVSQTMIIQGGLTVADVTLNSRGQHDQLMGALGAGAQYGILLPFSRSHESEADYMGIRYMARAGYDPSVAPDIWVRMGQGREQPPEYLSTHPSHERRTRDLQEALDEAMGFYQAAPMKYGVGEPLK